MNDQTRTKMATQVLQLFEEGHSAKDIKAFLPSLFPKQNKANMQMTIEKSIEMCISLQRAVDEAGGSGFKVDRLCKMTVIELISILGINNIRFIYTKRNMKKDYIDSKQKLKEIKKFAKNMLLDFKEQLKKNPDNLVAAMATDIYEEIIEKLNGKQ